jgi:DNA-binding SARP family transcriptional activator/tetratricopeptide (TPR) repeat protein
MRFLILGPLEVRGEQGVVALGGNKLRGLLAVLLLQANKPVSAERLALALWGQDAPSGVTKTVQVTVSRLRKALGDRVVIATTPAGYCLQMQPDELDATRFERLVEDGARALDSGQPLHAAAVLREALSLWRGPPLADLAFEPFAPAEIARLEEQRLAALEARIEADLAAGRHSELVGELRRLVAVDPTRERLAAQLMLALYRCGRQADALEAYQDTRRALIADVGIEPGSRLRELQEAILRQDTALEPNDGLRDLSSARETVTAWPPVAHDDGLVVLTLPRSLHVPAGAAFVGRDAELARLHEHWTQIGGGARSAVVIGGEPGIGKTRLASEFARVLHGEGELVLYGRCDEGLAVPYQPFVEALRPYARAVGLDCLRVELGDLAHELGRLLPELAGLGAPMRADPQSERFALFEAVAALIEAMTRERRVLLVLDDLHWAAGPTLWLLRHLIRSERQLDVLMLGTFRETELDASQPLAQLLGDLQRDASARRMNIGGLDESAIAVLLEAAVGHALDERAPQLLRALGTQTAGNPFFIRELLAHLTESGERVDTRVTAARLEAPKGLRQVIGHRVARLSAPTKRALNVAAVAGSTFSFVLLERALGERSGALDALDEAVAAGLLAEAGHGDYAFAHALVRETIYGQLGSARRMRLHRQLGEALEALGDREAHVAALAHHFAQAAADGQGVKAATYALAAGRSATSRLGYEEAAAHYERGLQALTLTGQPQEQRRCELLLALGEARWGAGELDNARRAYEQAAELAEQLGDATALARAALGFCGPHRFEMAPAVTEPVAGQLQRALAALGDEDSPLRAQLMGRLAAARAFTGVEHRKPRLARQALEMARRVADNTALADVLASTHWAIHGPDTLRASMRLAEELGRLADELGDSRLRALAHGWLLDHLLELGDIDGVERELKALQHVAETRRERYFKWVVTVFRANHALLRGQLEDFESLAHDAFAHRFEGHDEPAARIFGAQMLFIRCDNLVESLESFVAQYPQIAVWRGLLAHIYAQLERRAQARQELEALARADFYDLPRDANWLPTLTTLCELVVLLGDAPRAQQLYKLLLPYADRCVVIFALLCGGSASRPLGILATTLSRYEDAARHFEQALTMNTQIRSPLLIALTQHDYAHMLLLRNRPGDSDKALRLLEQAVATAEQLGLKALADKARPLKLTAETAGRSLALPGSV